MTPPLHALPAGHSDRSLPLMSALSDFLHNLQTPAHLLVAISGGSDSTGLLVGLASLMSSLPEIRLSAATIDHALRPEAADEAQAVARLCAELGISHVTRRWEGEKPATGISAAAREARYSLLSAIAAEIGATAIVTGHTVDDQVETVVMRAGRLAASDADDRGGSGLPISSSTGLSGMAPATLLDARHWVLRPLLHTSRADIRAYLIDVGIGWIDDPSNLDPHYERVRTRQALASDVSAIDAGVISAAAQARARLAQQAADWLAAHATVEHAIIARIDPAGLAENPATTRHALCALAAVLGGRPHMLSRENAGRLMTFVESGTHGRMTAGRVVFDRRRDGFYMLRENRNLPQLIVKADRAAIWDERFLVANHAGHPVEILPGIADAEVFETVPPGLARLAARVSPHVADGHDAEVVMMPRLALFDRFLPVFDLPLANRIAVLMGNNTYLLPPV
ncbi:tRNA(Ile)-lysidine synthase [Neorhizobium huautlense]|uniref:tRNA(Ile)-lysidine synthase n=1 Tax=Neorhizobium huautlense TaxID=67774 RepID=A0ABT9PWN6_9HYPH|nr:tRNA lysidine(34) synthetase TilS [Neorhizobium huautlense]MDP9838842.1 tRNA(Ile)-lysidine synthase [Neorhizobium huautlense]